MNRIYFFFIIKRNIISYYGANFKLRNFHTVSNNGRFIFLSVLSWVAHGTHSITPFPFCVSYFIDRPPFCLLNNPEMCVVLIPWTWLPFFQHLLLWGLYYSVLVQHLKKVLNISCPICQREKRSFFFLLLYLYYYFFQSFLGPFSIWSVSSFFLSFFFFFFISSFWAVADLWHLLRIVFLSFSLPSLGGGILWQEPDEFSFASFHHKDIGSWAPCAWLGIRLYTV